MMYTCKTIMHTCKESIYTCILNYVYMQDSYVYMQDIYVYIQDDYVYIITENLSSAMKTLYSDVSSGSPYYCFQWQHLEMFNTCYQASYADKTTNWLNLYIMMTSSNVNIFSTPALLCGKFTGHWWIPLTKTSDAEHWCFFFTCAWTNNSANNGNAGYLRRHSTHYDASHCNVKHE